MCFPPLLKENQTKSVVDFITLSFKNLLRSIRCKTQTQMIKVSITSLYYNTLTYTVIHLLIL